MSADNRPSWAAALDAAESTASGSIREAHALIETGRPYPDLGYLMQSIVAVADQLALANAISLAEMRIRNLA